MAKKLGNKLVHTVHYTTKKDMYPECRFT